jgi:phage/plasmid-associated DNA primase
LSEDILAAEKALIIHWALEGLRRWNKSKKFTEFSSHESAMRAWHHRADSVEQWLQDYVVPAPEEAHSNDWPRKEDHYAAYAEWAKRCGFKPAALNRFGGSLAAMGLSARVRRGGLQVGVHKVRILMEECSRPNLNLDLN